MSIAADCLQRLLPPAASPASSAAISRCASRFGVPSSRFSPIVRTVGLSQVNGTPVLRACLPIAGAIQVWIEIGAPDAARVQKASKASPRVAVYAHRDVTQILKQWAGERIHRMDALELYSFDRSLIAALAAKLERRMAMALSRTDGHLFLTVGDVVLEGQVARVPVGS
jgi:uncharacterized protein YaeQ